MDTINGIPLVWDEEEGKKLLGNLLINTSLFSSTVPISSDQRMFANSNLGMLLDNQASDYPWSTYWSNELRDVFFGGFQNKASGPDDPIEVTDETEIYNSLKAERKAVFYTDNNRNKKYDEGDKYLFDIKLFISKDGAKLQRAWLGAKPGDNELLIFLENNEGDQVSGQRLFSKAGKNVEAQIGDYSDSIKIFEWINGIHTISKKSLKELLISTRKVGWFVRMLKKALSVATKIATWPIEKLSELFFWIGEKIQKNLRIENDTWNSGSDAKKQIGEHQHKVSELFKDFFKDWKHDDPDSLKSKTIPQYEKILDGVLEGALKLAEKYAEKIPEIIFAAVCGIVNGIVDLIAGFFTFIGVLLKLIHTSIQKSADVVANLDYYVTLILEYQDNFIQALREVKWQKVIEDAYTAYFNFLYIQLPLLLIQAFVSLTEKDPIQLAKEIAYYVGYIGINIVICFIPIVDLIELTQITKLAKPLQQLFEVILKLVRKGGKFVATSTSEIFNLLEGFLEMIRKGTDEVVNFVKKIFEAIKEWLEELLGLSNKKIRWELLDDVPSLKGFTKWFDNLTFEEFQIVWNNLKLKNKIMARLRHPGGMHEWLMVARTDKFKKWNVPLRDIKRLRTKIEDVIFVNPPGVHGGPGSTKAHNEILKLIDEAKSYDEFKKKLILWADKRLQGGSKSLPKGF